MKRLKARAVALSPVVLPEEGYITGSTFRGALAYQYLRSRGIADPAHDDLFQRAFVQERLRVSPLYPGRFPLPLTAVSCKRHPGFSSPRTDTHGVFDLLWYRLAGKTAPLSCPKCRQDLKGWSGFYTREEQQGLSTSLETHVGIERLTGTASNGVLYTLQTLDPGQELYATITLLDDDLEDVLSPSIRCGAERTRGRGNVQLSYDEDSIPSNEARMQSWKEWSRNLSLLTAENNETFYFAITLVSDTIIVDRYLRPSADLSDAISWLPSSNSDSHITFSDGTLRFCTTVRQTRVIKGWNGAHGLPRERDMAITKGSVFVYAYQGGNSGLTELYNLLSELETYGIGLRRGEGFGLAAVNSPFHAEFAEVK